MSSRLRISAVAIALIVAASLAQATVLHVSPDGTGDYPTIQAALDAAVSWDEIELADGVYTGDGNRDIIHPALYLTIRSQSGDPTACVIDIEAGPGNAHFGLKYGDGG